MATQFVQREGVAIVEMELRVSDNRTIPLTSNTILLSRAEIVETCEGFSSAKFFITSAGRDYVDKLLKEAMANQTPRMRWRIGIGFPQSGGIEFIPWQDHIIRNAANGLQGLGDAATGYTTILETADFLWEINRVTKVASYKGRISDIVQQIANIYNLQAVIEPTKTSGQYYQSYTSDYQFIMDRMVPRAINDKNRGNYQFYIRDGTLHFHTIDYQAELKSFTYYNSPGTNLASHDQSQELVRRGSGGARVIFIDPYTGEFGAVDSIPDNALRLSNTAPDLAKIEAPRQIQMALGTNRSIDPTSISSNVYEAVKSSVYTLSLTIPRTLFFRANDLCRVTIQPDNRQVPPTSGVYQVYKIKHSIDKSSLLSEVLFRRGEFLTKDKTQASTQSGETLVEPERSAPGQDPNLKAVSSSLLTKGIGPQTGGSVVVETQDPNTAPGT